MSTNKESECVLEYYKKYSQNRNLNKYFTGTSVSYLPGHDDAKLKPHSLPEIRVTGVTERSPNASLSEDDKKLEWDNGADIGYTSARLNAERQLRKSSSLPLMNVVNSIKQDSSGTSGSGVGVVIINSSSTTTSEQESKKSSMSTSTSSATKPTSSSSNSSKFKAFQNSLNFLKTQIGMPDAQSTPLSNNPSVVALLSESESSQSTSRNKKVIELSFSTPININCQNIKSKTTKSLQVSQTVMAKSIQTDYVAQHDVEIQLTDNGDSASSFEYVSAADKGGIDHHFKVVHQLLKTKTIPSKDKKKYIKKLIQELSDMDSSSSSELFVPRKKVKFKPQIASSSESSSSSCPCQERKVLATESCEQVSSLPLDSKETTSKEEKVDGYTQTSPTSSDSGNMKTCPQTQSAAPPRPVDLRTIATSPLNESEGTEMSPHDVATSPYLTETTNNVNQSKATEMSTRVTSHDVATSPYLRTKELQCDVTCRPLVDLRHAATSSNNLQFTQSKKTETSPVNEQFNQSKATGISTRVALNDVATSPYNTTKKTNIATSSHIPHCDVTCCTPLVDLRHVATSSYNLQFKQTDANVNEQFNQSKATGMSTRVTSHDVATSPYNTTMKSNIATSSNVPQCDVTCCTPLVDLRHVATSINGQSKQTQGTDMLRDNLYREVATTSVNTNQTKATEMPRLFGQSKGTEAPRIDSRNIATSSHVAQCDVTTCPSLHNLKGIEMARDVNPFSQLKHQCDVNSCPSVSTQTAQIDWRNVATSLDKQPNQSKATEMARDVQSKGTEVPRLVLRDVATSPDKCDTCPSICTETPQADLRDVATSVELRDVAGEQCDVNTCHKRSHDLADDENTAKLLLEINNLMQKLDGVTKIEEPHSPHLSIASNSSDRSSQLKWINNEIAHLSKLKKKLEKNTSTNTYQINQANGKRNFVIETKLDSIPPNINNYIIDDKEYVVTDSSRKSSTDSDKALIEINRDEFETKIKVTTVCSKCNEIICKCTSSNDEFFDCCCTKDGNPDCAFVKKLLNKFTSMDIKCKNLASQTSVGVLAQQTQTSRACEDKSCQHRPACGDFSCQTDHATKDGSSLTKVDMTDKSTVKAPLVPDKSRSNSATSRERSKPKEVLDESTQYSDQSLTNTSSTASRVICYCCKQKAFLAEVSYLEAGNDSTAVCSRCYFNQPKYCQRRRYDACRCWDYWYANQCPRRCDGLMYTVTMDGKNGVDVQKGWSKKSVKDKENYDKKESNGEDEVRSTLREHLTRNRPEFIYSAEYRRQMLLHSRISREQQKDDAKLSFLDRDDNTEKYKLFTGRQMKEINKRNYKKLPEVQNRLVYQRENKLKKADRLISSVFAKKVQKSVLEGKRNFPIDQTLTKLK